MSLVAVLLSLMLACPAALSQPLVVCGLSYGSYGQAVVPVSWASDFSSQGVCYRFGYDATFGGCGAPACLFPNGTYSRTGCGALPNPNCGWSKPSGMPNPNPQKAADDDWKLCGTKNSGNYMVGAVRTGVDWTTHTCSDWAKALAGNYSWSSTSASLMCAFKWIIGGYSYSHSVTAMPSPNCGWTAIPPPKALSPAVPAYKVCITWAPASLLELPVSWSWTPQHCKEYMLQQGASQMALACIHSNGFSLGASGGQIPFPNCGW